MKRVTLKVPDRLHALAERRARLQGYSSTEAWLGAVLTVTLDSDDWDFTRCEDDRFLLDPGGGLALAEDREDDAFEDDNEVR